MLNVLSMLLCSCCPLIIIWFPLFHAAPSHYKPPPPLIRTISAESPLQSAETGRGGKLGNQRHGSEATERKKSMGKGAGSKRSKYRTEEEKMVKEKERRNANNQRERLATCVLTQERIRTGDLE